ncbi:MAG: HD-GYP domain-containing protein, partial [Anaerolineae bacterium]|nr:HD-GYP domain-containing protein [Anaerolineae bacterium]
AIVITTYALNRLRPRVLVVRDPDGKPCRQHVVDLRRRDEYRPGMPYQISRELPLGSHGIDLRVFTEEGLEHT